MKKLMIAAAIVCAAAVVQAATVSWTITNLKSPSSSSTALSGGYVLTFCTTGSYGTNAGQIKNALTAAAVTDLASFKAALAGFTAIDGLSGAMTQAGAFNATTAASNLGVAAETGNTKLFSLIFDGPTIDASTKWMYTASCTGTSFIDPAGTINWDPALNDTRSATGTNWNAIPNVPEPTSGLLLLLGVAGLALKRKRA